MCLLHLQSLQEARHSAHVEFTNHNGIWKMSQHHDIIKQVEQQAVQLTKVRQSEHEYIFSEALKAQDETLRSIVKTIEMILHVRP